MSNNFLISFCGLSVLVDVGSKVHSVKADEKPRLVLKYAIRSNWNDMYDRLNKRRLIDRNKTMQCNPYYMEYESKLTENNKKFVNTLEHAIDLASKNFLVTIGAKAKEPNSNFGYIFFYKF